jgi:Uma2 family endonuclease
MNLIPPLSRPLLYPESDGKPLADNTKQARWILLLYGNLQALFAAEDVFVAADLFWYAVEGFPEVCTAPDILVVFGRPKGDRGSYRQWEEENIPVTVVFEVLSPANTHQEMIRKLLFYEEHGVEEYYVYDPDDDHLEVHLRQGDMLRAIRPVHGFVSPRLKIRFDLTGEEMVVIGPNGRRFLSFEEVEGERAAAQQRADKADQHAEDERQQRLIAEERADKAEDQVEQTRQRIARIVELSRKVRQQQASPEEAQELERLEDEAASP